MGPAGELAALLAAMTEDFGPFNDYGNAVWRGVSDQTLAAAFVALHTHSARLAAATTGGAATNTAAANAARVAARGGGAASSGGGGGGGRRGEGLLWEGLLPPFGQGTSLRKTPRACAPRVAAFAPLGPGDGPGDGPGGCGSSGGGTRAAAEWDCAAPPLLQPLPGPHGPAANGAVHSAPERASCAPRGAPEKSAGTEAGQWFRRSGSPILSSLDMAHSLSPPL